MEQKKRVQNFIGLVNDIKKEYDRGMPNGLDEQFFKKLPHLFRRLEELETALVPFARAAVREKDFGGDVYTVNAQDCIRAYDVLDPQNAYNPKGER